MPRKNAYTVQEIDFIKENASRFSWEHIAKELGRSPNALRTFVSKAGIRGAYSPMQVSAHAKVIKCPGLFCCNYFTASRQRTKYCSTICQETANNIKRYGISVEKWHQLFVEQAGQCVCGGRFNSISDVCIDHDHKCCPSANRNCGKCVRALLCKPCNFILGLAKDDPTRLNLLADYLSSQVTQTRAM